MAIAALQTILDRIETWLPSSRNELLRLWSRSTMSLEEFPAEFADLLK